jgi:hypothetical protein
VPDAIPASALAELRDMMNQRLADETDPDDNHIRFPRWRTAENNGRWSTVPQHITDQHNMIHWGKALRDLLTAVSPLAIRRFLWLDLLQKPCD